MISEQYLIEIILKRDEIEDFNQYPFSLEAFRNFDRLALHPKVTFFVGENGTGKSTLLEAIAVANEFNPEGAVRTLDSKLVSPIQIYTNIFAARAALKRPKGGYFLRAESFYNVATEIDNLDSEPSFGPPIVDFYGGKSLHEQSHGESFLALLMNRFSGESLYILDEPEAALSPSRQLSMICRMHELVSLNCQFLIATHSSIIMAYPEADILVLGENGLEKTAYEDTEHYQVTKSFMVNRERILRQLLSSST